MQQVTSIKEIETAISQNGEMIIGKNNKNDVIVMSIEEYKNRLLEDDIEKKLTKAEKQIDEGKTIKASEVFEELKEKYGF